MKLNIGSGPLYCWERTRIFGFMGVQIRQPTDRRASWSFNDVYHLGFYASLLLYFRILYCSDLLRTLSHSMETSLIFSKIFFKTKIHDFPAKLEPNLVHLRSPKRGCSFTHGHTPTQRSFGYLFYKHSYIYLFILVVGEMEARINKIWPLLQKYQSLNLINGLHNACPKQAAINFVMRRRSGDIATEKCQSSASNRLQEVIRLQERTKPAENQPKFSG